MRPDSVAGNIEPHRLRPTDSAACVAEITGPYGPVVVAEKVIQRLWERGAFTGIETRLVSGEAFRLISPGRPNRQEGPDFIEATWMQAGQRITGDVELHFYQADWRAHGHDRAPTFDRVRLHAVVFPPRPGEPGAVTGSGFTPPVLVLLPHLPEDLESAALEDVLLRTEGRPEALTEKLAALPPAERAELLVECARSRWEGKVAFAKRRIETDGVDAALHGMFLETLGLRRNRAPMAALAARHSPADFARVAPEVLYAEQATAWRLAGVRPANHPLARLRAYAALNRVNLDWIYQLKEALFLLPPYPVTEDAVVFRKRGGLPALREQLRSQHLAGAVGGSRLDTLVVDAILPWESARSDRDHFPLWRHWPLGDAPANFAATLAALGLAGRQRPATNGAFQALLALALRP